MRWTWHILTTLTGVALVAPKAIAWIRFQRAPHAVRQFYQPEAHTDFVVVVGGKGVSLETILTCLAVLGFLLVLAGVWGTWRSRAST